MEPIGTPGAQLRTTNLILSSHHIEEERRQGPGEWAGWAYSRLHSEQGQSELTPRSPDTEPRMLCSALGHGAGFLEVRSPH